MACHPPLPDLWSRCLWALLLGSSLLFGVLAGSSQAQITLDGSLGPPGPVHGPHSRIGADVGQIRGSNLFHSFGEFNVPTGGSATFTGPNTIANILSRVTGGQPSAIDGVLRSEIAGANLFLLNPNGVLFGPNASLDVSRSFHVSTADFLRFEDGATFSAHLGQAGVLTVAPPAAFGFVSANPAPMTIQGSSLQVAERTALSMVGGDINIVGNGGPLTDASVRTLRAPSGRVQLVSVASPGEVVFSRLELTPELQADSVARLGRLEVTRGALVDASGDGGGTVLIRAGRLLVDHGSVIFADNTGKVEGVGLGLDLRITADAVIRNASILATDSLSSGRARDLRLTAGSLHLEDQAIISATTFMSGRGGDVTVVATDAISITGRSSEGVASGLYTNVFSSGDGGRLFVAAPRLTMDEGLIVALTMLESRGRAGDVEVRGGRVALTGGAAIGSSAGGAGAGGRVTVSAGESIAIAGRGTQGNQSGMASVAAGDPGHLSLAAPTVTVEGGFLGTPSLMQGGQAGDTFLTADTLVLSGGAQIVSGTVTDHAGGNITIETGRLTMNGGAIIVATSGFGRGAAGEITVTARESVALSQNSLIASSTLGQGPAGRIALATPRLHLSDGGTISARSVGDGGAGMLVLDIGEIFRSQGGHVTTTADRAGGGMIALRAGRLVQLIDSELSTTVQGGGSDAGNLILDAPVILSAASQIRANAFAGTGGQIDIRSNVFLADPTSQVSASSTFGIQGTVNIQAPVTSLSGTLAPLPQAFVNVAALLPARCAARAQGGRTSSLVLGGRDGLPADPSSVLPSPLVLDERLVVDPVVTAGPHQPLSTTKFAFLTGADKAFPRLRGDQWAGRCPKAM
jgi:filamentous hemagglutinin family protein